MKKKIIAVIFIVIGLLVGIYSVIDLHSDVDKYKNYYKIEGKVTNVDEEDTTILVESEDEGELNGVYYIDNKFYHNIGDKIEIYIDDVCYYGGEDVMSESTCDPIESKFLVFFTDFLWIVFSTILFGIGSKFVFDIFSNELRTQLETVCNTKKVKSTKKSN